MPARFLYIFLDESGNMDFSKNGTRFFLIAGLVQERPFEAYKALCDLRYDLIESGEDIHWFHATEDQQPVRNRVFAIIQQNLDHMRVDALIIEKRKTHPSLQQESRFYPEMIGYLLRHILTLARMLPRNVTWRVLHHPSHCNFDLQIADYCNWAIYRKWNDWDVRSYDLIRPAIRKEFDIFARGTKFYY